MQFRIMASTIMHCIKYSDIMHIAMFRIMLFSDSEYSYKKLPEIMLMKSKYRKVRNGKLFYPYLFTNRSCFAWIAII